MSLTGTVGPGARNARTDVKVAQVLLNANAARIGLAEPLVEDGAYGPKTGDAIRACLRTTLAIDGAKIEPDSPALARLREGLPTELTARALQGIVAQSPASIVDRYAPYLLQRMPANGIDTPFRIAHFLAQLGHESAGFRYTEEIATGEAYEGRRDLGNTEPGDGRRFKGRGLIQLTGRSNYVAYGKAVGMDLTGDARTTLSIDPLRAVDVACWFWRARGLNERADRDDLEAVTRRINGGLNGLADRAEHLRRARFFVVG